MSKNQKAIYLEWDDSISVGDVVWVNRKHVEDKKNLTCKSVGFLLKEDKRTITLGCSIAPDAGAIMGNITIPKCAIRKRRVVNWKGDDG